MNELLIWAPGRRFRLVVVRAQQSSLVTKQSALCATSAESHRGMERCAESCRQSVLRSPQRYRERAWEFAFVNH